MCHIVAAKEEIDLVQFGDLLSEVGLDLLPEVGLAVRSLVQAEVRAADTGIVRLDKDEGCVLVQLLHPAVDGEVERAKGAGVGLRPKVPIHFEDVVVAGVEDADDVVSELVGGGNAGVEVVAKNVDTFFGDLNRVNA